MRHTREPDCARVSARLAIVVDLPSPGIEEVSRIVLGWLAALTNIRLVRTARNASERGDAGSDSTMSGSLPARGS